jgi:hypothetical protein
MKCFEYGKRLLISARTKQEQTQGSYLLDALSDGSGDSDFDERLHLQVVDQFPPVVDDFKLFFFVTTKELNKLVCLSMQSFYSR